jgi:hypothetical protein
MIIRPAQLRPIPSFLLPPPSTTFTQTRCLHHARNAPRIPSPTKFVPDAKTFLSLIGRNLSQHASKITSWKALFSLTSQQLKELGIEPPRARRYLLRWREKFRKGQYGIGGDFKHVKDGVAELQVRELPAEPGHDSPTGTRKIVVNVPSGSSAKDGSAADLVVVKGLSIKGAQTIVGPYTVPVKGGGGSKIVVQEGLWEDRRGHKVDGGERRWAENQAKRRAEERKNAS